MGGLCPVQKEPERQVQRNPQKQTIQQQVQNVDVVKMKLKQARDKIKTFISRKEKDVAQLDAQIKSKVPQYERTGNKKPLVPLLQAKKELNKIIENGDVRLRLVNDKLNEVEMQQLNKETIDVLDDSNKYCKEIQQHLQAKDWQNVLAEAQQKVEIEWPDDSEEIQEDPAFKAMWEQIGGNKVTKEVAKKQVNVNVQQHRVQQREKAANYA